MLLQICVGVGFALTLATQDKLVVWPEIAPPTADTPSDANDSKPDKPAKAPLSFANVAGVVATPPRWACESREQFDIARFVDLVSRPTLKGDDSGNAVSAGKPAPHVGLGCGAPPACRNTSRQSSAIGHYLAAKPRPVDLPQIVRTGPPSCNFIAA